MEISNETKIIAKPYLKKDAEEIVNLIIRNFRKVIVKDYREKAIAALSATHNMNWFKDLAEYANVYVF